MCLATTVIENTAQYHTQRYNVTMFKVKTNLCSYDTPDVSYFTYPSETLHRKREATTQKTLKVT